MFLMQNEKDRLQHDVPGAPDPRRFRVLEHDPEKWNPVFGQDHAQINKQMQHDNSKSFTPL
jgi:hypothetical protein